MIDYNARSYQLFKFDLGEQLPYNNYDIYELLYALKDPKRLMNMFLNEIERKRTYKQRRNEYLKKLIKKDHNTY